MLGIGLDHPSLFKCQGIGKSSQSIRHLPSVEEGQPVPPRMLFPTRSHHVNNYIASVTLLPVRMAMWRQIRYGTKQHSRSTGLTPSVTKKSDLGPN